MPVRPTTPGALVRRTLGRQRRGLAGAIALITLWQVCEAGVPVLIGVVIDRAVATGDVASLLWWGAVLCVLFTVLSLAFRFGSRIGVRAGQEEGHLLRTEVSAHVLSPRGARVDRLPGDVLAVATGDADLVAEVIDQVVYTVAGIAGLVVEEDRAHDRSGSPHGDGQGDGAETQIHQQRPDAGREFDQFAAAAGGDS